MTYVTCPTMRYHPAVVAQKAATVGLLSRGPVHPRARRRGEPQRARRRARLAAGQRRATRCSTRRSRSSARCSAASYVNFAGEHFRVDRRGCGTSPTGRVPIGGRGVRASSRSSGSPRSPTHMIAVEPDAVARCRAGSTPPAARAEPRDRSDADLLGPRPGPARSSARTSSSAGSAAAGRSTPSCPARRAFAGATQFVRPGGRRRVDPVRPGRRRASWRRCASSSRPASPTSPSSRSAAITQAEFLDWAEREFLPAVRDL